VSGYWAYYALILFSSYATQNPYLAGGVVLLWLLRGVVPDPVALWRAFGRLGSMKAQATANPSNVTVRRALARTYLELRRPKRALKFVLEALERDSDDAELLYLEGVARLRAGDPSRALEPLVRAVSIDPKLLYGEPYRVAAEALLRLGRLEEAEDALQRFLEKNGSSIGTYVQLGRVRSSRGDRDGARAALRDAVATWSQIPAFAKRREVLHWIHAHALRAWL
jgi:tetratricopeptide (TPR) repeat protein